MTRRAVTPRTSSNFVPNCGNYYPNLALNYPASQRLSSENQLFICVAYRLLSPPGMSQLEVLRDTTGMQGFDYPTLEEIVTLWRSYQATGGLRRKRRGMLLRRASLWIWLSPAMSARSFLSIKGGYSGNSGVINLTYKAALVQLPHDTLVHNIFEF